MQNIKDLKVWIDNADTSMDDVFPFYQRDPYPGDHTYQLQLFFENEQSMKQFIEQYSLDEYEGVDFNIFFLGLSSYWPADVANRPAKYFLNNVQKTKIDKTSIILKGACSTVLR